MKWKTLLFGTWSWRRPFYSIGFIYLALGVIALFFSNHLLFLPPSPYQSDLPLLCFTKNSTGQKVAAIYSAPQSGKAVFLWNHGNAHDISALIDYAEALSEYGLGLYAYDYPGYGLSEGSPDEEGCYENARAAWRDLTENKGIPAKNIIIVGQSIGTGAAVELAREVEESGVILLSPFTSIYRVAVGFPIYPRDQFINQEKIHAIGSPLLIFHGDEDRVIPYRHSVELIKRHPGPKELITLEGSGHNDMFVREHARIFDQMLRFTARVSASRSDAVQ